MVDIAAPPGLIPPEMLPILQSEAAVQFDAVADWYPAGSPNVNGDRSYPPVPTQLPARFVKQTREFYTQGGQQAQVSEQLIYLPYGSTVQPLDKLVRHGQDVTHSWPTNIEITVMPSPATPIFIKVRQGAT